ncbi:16S rRNA (cytosine(1402)-N(4))-methyltransferase RsmH [Capnocytophaga canimorsus]|uniref:16S rRNA (cytosine(1402)-N(4))-methyltransferase RsmH n=1 Tax=Capnocytophaga canimorsus TaxID=28188 RepID=UPI000D6E4B4D|nr:16S rRNA (cytosine(1402)-N(4))-methyltransferase RsmH [Capnocytophaga canimorsus]AWL78608.1 16S rRNA (cytosine(1402)-N(4))-methyltransferase [Capnocytophaga canimorsus]AYW37219.1 16S rRNA (cytosine(1402)-N(4))-methyltransferase RsmH [Capnocytophaga canimorsus]MDT9499972.1 16S rRNA (cytosine(1402)-N(4))-methyltransferase RsmH [Capnocytophaga canimorsus]
MNKTTTTYHNPVLLLESVDALAIKQDGVYVDVTFGGGGHSREILSRLGANGRLYAFDQDTDATKNAINDERFTLINENFRYLKRYLRFYGIKQVDGVLGDFGVSSYQFDKPERGFSIRFDGILDMRMDINNPLSAQEVLNEYSEEDLANLLYKYGELRNARAIAKHLVNQRKQKKITTSTQLKSLLDPFLPKFKENKILAQIYQAIRIEVNSEIQALEEFLLQLPEIVKIGGRISLISYHSLEDRLVKRFIRDGQLEGSPEKDFFGNTNVPFKKVGGLILPSTSEIQANNRARSAKLRVAEKI